MPEAGTAQQFEKKEFQTEVKRLLDIVINSLYTDREIFLRELISNSADALEKLRYQSVVNKEIIGKDLPLEIPILLDDKEHTITITDTGIGMTRDELIENLGTIAHSGSKTFIQQLNESDQKDLSLIGQFGVGFYSAFMVAKKIRLLTRSYLPNETGCEWVSEGLGSYDLRAVEDLPRGTKIILELKEDAHEFAGEARIKEIIREYSSFVPFPIKVNGEQVNTVQAIWTRNKNEVTEEEYNEFYKFIATAHDEPLYRLHFTADAPLAINALLFVPQNNFERFGFGRMEPGTNLYSRKILIQPHSESILPEWLRFVKGVVDSEDIPLNISRETAQDSALIAKLQRVITGRFLRFLDKEAQDDPEKYAEFWSRFNMFIKEGATTDFTYRRDLTKLLRFESSAAEPGRLISLADYADRMKDGQNDIYFTNGPTRESIEAGPYIEAFRAAGYEVIYNYEPIDDFIFSNLGEYEEKKFVSADRAGLELPDLEEKAGEEPLDSEKTGALTTWLKEALGDQVSEVKVSKRLVESPAIILNLNPMITSSMERVMQVANQDISHMGGKALEINTRHKLIKKLDTLREKDPKFARTVAEQIFDHALIAAGLVVNPLDMVERVNQILEKAL
ncbi:MAG: molecular chaperone HtpG [Peptococcaceae bacterium]|nr:molecular chaperone HtpG [Candidatus Syntrophopropionicum ammoniitolerans]